jgi:hypothetical protein
MEEIFGKQKPVLFLFRDDNESTDKDARFMRVFEEASKQSSMLFSYSGISTGYQQNLAELLAVT